MATFKPASTVGEGFTITVTELDTAQPDGSVTVTVYKVLCNGLATGLATKALLKPVAGVH
jgi:hypothetical protein